LKEVLTKHPQKKVRQDLLYSLTSNNDNFLNMLNQSWTAAIVMIRDILMYLDTTFVKESNKEPVFNLCLIQYRDLIIRDQLVKDHLSKTLLDMVQKERNGELIDSSGIQKACEMLMKVGLDSRDVYVEIFEASFLQQSVDFYRLKREKYLAENSSNGYQSKIEKLGQIN
jgi:cullin 3